MSKQDSLPPLFDEFSSIDVDEWRAHVREELGDSFSESLLNWSSLEGVSLPTYLDRSHLEEILHVDSEASFPPLSDGNRQPANDWRIRQNISHPDPNTANERSHAALQGGVTDLGLGSFRGNAQTLPATIADLDARLEGIDLTSTGIHFGTGPAGVVVSFAFREVLSSQEQIPNAVRGSAAYDPVAALATGSIETPDRAFQLAEHLIYDFHASPDFQPVSIDARVYHDAGASTVQELAFTIGALSEILARGTERGVSLSAQMEGLHLIVPVSTSYFVEIAKLRALRLLLPQVIQAFAAEADSDDAFSAPLPIQAETSRRTETSFDPHVNLLRATTEAMAAVLGGCDILNVRPFEASLDTNSEFSSRLARNTQLILRHEAHLDQVADAAAGSYYLETMTDQLAQKAWSQFQELEDQGGLLAALQAGTVQENIKRTLRRRRQAVNERDQVLVGATHYPALGERRSEEVVPSSNEEQSSPSSPELNLDDLTPRSIRRALRDGATIPSITKALHPEEASIEPLPKIRLSEPIETLRLRTERYAETNEGPPTVFLVPMGPVSARSARATFARNYLGVAGFEIIENLKFETPADAAKQAVEAKADVVVLCSADGEYPSLAPALQTELTERGLQPLLVIAGHPDKIEENLPATAFIYQGAPLQETLEHLQEELGMI